VVVGTGRLTAKGKDENDEEEEDDDEVAKWIVPFCIKRVPILSEPIRKFNSKTQHFF
jgi:hypothetical protein